MAEYAPLPWVVVMDPKVTTQQIGEECGVILPRDVLDRLGWKEGRTLELRVDDTGIEIFDAQKISDKEFQRQIFAAKMAMRKYHKALSELAKS
ncbi:AbrB/MazE/SpoVT family DNA-binding domain-containing protein [Rhizobium sp. LC145]|uniref:AbrB/MazE/SpoVT family DNA-binding domain-containing protein n=1 Tax=Rhizobium sp. LC145 TaxID=1120688 RepID=UPI001FD9AA96|nr:AbrB/MazE/SpoVT family DNA-binding domain-containing protein [Rhizobium sp. LC145]